MSCFLLQVREFVKDTGIENLGKRLVNSKEGKVEFERPSMNVDTLLKCALCLFCTVTVCRMIFGITLSALFTFVVFGCCYVTDERCGGDRLSNDTVQ